MNEYPECWKDIDSLMICVPSIEGVNFASELFAGELNLHPDAVEDFANSKIENENIQLLLTVLNKSGVLDALLKWVAEPLLRVAVMDAIRDVAHDIFATQPAMWTFVYGEYFEKALINIFGEDYANPEHEYAATIKKITYYHENVQTRYEEILTDVKNSGIHLALICKYDKPPIPVGTEGNLLGDGFVSLQGSSFGATCAKLGEILPADYKQAMYTDYDFLSPDHRIDASTGLIPFTTWYIRGLAHTQRIAEYFDLVNKIVYNNLDVFTDESCPQFFEIDPEDSEKIIIMQEKERVEKKSLIEDFIKLLKNLFTILVDKIKGLFA